MTKVRKQKRRKRYRANVNRKRLRNKLGKLPNIKCTEIKQAWEVTKSTRRNLDEMGLAYDANEILKIPNTKQEILERYRRKLEQSSDSDSEADNAESSVPKKVYVAKHLEADAKAPRERSFRLPKGQVQFVTYMIDKYGEDYKAMARDKKNYYQLTWKQIYAKIKLFKGIPEQYNEYLQSRNTEN